MPTKQQMEATLTARMNRGTGYTFVPPPLPACADTLPLALRNSAQQYLSVRRQGGDALLEAVRLLSEAHKAAVHGEWGVYLETIGLEESRARAQIRMHEKAAADPLFAEQIRNGFLSEAVARELLPAPAEVQQEVLSSGKPPTLRDVRQAKRASTPDIDIPPPERRGERRPPAPTRLQPANTVAETDMDDAIITRLAAAGYRWEHAKQTPDGRWHHVISARNTALLRNDQVLLRRERILALLSPDMTALDTDQSMLPEMPAPAAPTDLPLEYAIIQRRYVAQGYQLLSNIQGHHRAFVTRKEGMTGVVTFDWADVLSKLERLEAQTTPAEQPTSSEAAPARLICPTCGERILNGIWGDLNECGSCYHARQRAEVQAARAMSIEQLDATLPRSLSDAGFYWKVAEPPTIAHNDGWYRDAATVEAALDLAHDRAQERVEATDRRLSPGQYVSVMDLIGKLRAAVITGALADVASRARHIAQIAESPEG